MADEPDPGDALRRLLDERERAKRAVYAANMAREKAEEERDHVQKLFDMEVAEIQKLAADLARERAENSEWRAERLLADEQVVRERNDFKERAEKAERREKILETILNRVESELYSAIREEDEFIPLEDIVKEGEPTDMAKDDLDETLYGDPHEGQHGPAREPDQMPFSHFGVTPGRAIVAAARAARRHWQVLSFAVAAPFALMTLALGLASAGVYIDALRPLWSPWPDDAVKWAVGLLGTSVFTFLPLAYRAKRTPVAVQTKPSIGEVRANGDESGMSDKEGDEYLATLKEIFGEDDDDEEDEGTPDEE